MTRLVFLLVFYVVSCAAQADSPPHWKPFEVNSANSKFIAKVEVLDKRDRPDPWEWQYKLAVSASDSTETLWSAEYAFDGYSGGTLSDDGKYFVYANYWYYHDTPVLRIYSKEGNWRFTGRELRIDESSLRRTVSHKVWLKEGVAFQATNGNVTSLTIGTVQGTRQLKLTPIPYIVPVTNSPKPPTPTHVKL